MSKIVSKKMTAGSYQVTNGDKTVLVTKVTYPNDGTYWIAAAEWNRYLLTDPLLTKREAMINAKQMLEANEHGYEDY